MNRGILAQKRTRKDTFLSTLTGNSATPLLHSENDLTGYFAQFAKPRACIRVGLEAEFFGVNAQTGEAIPYEGPSGVEAILKTLASKFGYTTVVEEGHIIALQRGELMITLEPGGQVELSAPPVSDTFEIEKQLQAFLAELKTIQPEFPSVAWLAHGVHPFSSLMNTAWVPKKRYGIMWEHFKTHGTLGHEMMRLTATNQVSFDYLDEEDAMSGLRVALGISSIVSAIFANASFSEGRPNGFISRRMHIWNHMDPDRSGLILQMTRPGKTFQDYLDYLLDMPMMFLVRNGQWMAVKNLTFRQYIKKGYEGHKASLGDFELHLSGAFPEARLKQYVEIRGVDCQKPELIPALASFWKGILYDRDTRDEAWKLVSFATEENRLELHAAIAKEGLRAKLGGKPILPIARELVDLTCFSLGKQRQFMSQSECVVLQRIHKQILDHGKSPGEILLDRWEHDLQRSPAKLLEALRIA